MDLEELGLTGNGEEEWLLNLWQERHQSERVCHFSHLVTTDEPTECVDDLSELLSLAEQEDHNLTHIVPDSLSEYAQLFMALHHNEHQATHGNSVTISQLNAFQVFPDNFLDISCDCVREDDNKQAENLSDKTPTVDIDNLFSKEVSLKLDGRPFEQVKPKDNMIDELKYILQEEDTNDRMSDHLQEARIEVQDENISSTNHCHHGDDMSKYCLDVEGHYIDEKWSLPFFHEEVCEKNSVNSQIDEFHLDDTCSNLKLEELNDSTMGFADYLDLVPLYPDYQSFDMSIDEHADKIDHNNNGDDNWDETGDKFSPEETSDLYDFSFTTVKDSASSADENYCDELFPIEDIDMCDFSLNDLLNIETNTDFECSILSSNQSSPVSFDDFIDTDANAEMEFVPQDERMNIYESKATTERRCDISPDHDDQFFINMGVSNIKTEFDYELLPNCQQYQPVTNPEMKIECEHYDLSSASMYNTETNTEIRSECEHYDLSSASMYNTETNTEMKSEREHYDLSSASMYNTETNTEIRSECEHYDLSSASMYNTETNTEMKSECEHYDLSNASMYNTETNTEMKSECEHYDLSSTSLYNTETSCLHFHDDNINTYMENNTIVENDQFTGYQELSLNQSIKDGPKTEMNYKVLNEQSSSLDMLEIDRNMKVKYKVFSNHPSDVYSFALNDFVKSDAKKEKCDFLPNEHNDIEKFSLNDLIEHEPNTEVKCQVLPRVHINTHYVPGDHSTENKEIEYTFLQDEHQHRDMNEFSLNNFAETESSIPVEKKHKIFRSQSSELYNSDDVAKSTEEMLKFSQDGIYFEDDSFSMSSKHQSFNSKLRINQIWAEHNYADDRRRHNESRSCSIDKPAAKCDEIKPVMLDYDLLDDFATIADNGSPVLEEFACLETVVASPVIDCFQVNRLNVPDSTDMKKSLKPDMYYKPKEEIVIAAIEDVENVMPEVVEPSTSHLKITEPTKFESYKNMCIPGQPRHAIAKRTKKAVVCTKVEMDDNCKCRVVDFSIDRDVIKKCMRSIITIRSNDTLCLARSLAVLVAHAQKVLNIQVDEKSSYETLRNGDMNYRTSGQMQTALSLQKKASLSTIYPCTLGDIPAFEKILPLSLEIVVLSARQDNSVVYVSKGKKNEYQAFLYFSTNKAADKVGHFDVITNPKGFARNKLINKPIKVIEEEIEKYRRFG